MKIFAIVRSKMHRDSNNEYFCCYEEGDLCGLLTTLYEGGWYEAEVHRIRKRDKKMETEIYDCCIGSEKERKLLKKYYDSQKK